MIGSLFKIHLYTPNRKEVDKMNDTKKYTELIEPAIQLFKHGIKPAVAIPMDELNELEGYPFTAIGSTAMVFQNDLAKQVFEHRGGKGTCIMWGVFRLSS